jgi:hypothetical protein
MSTYCNGAGQSGIVDCDEESGQCIYCLVVDIEAENESLRKDAERYQWIRANQYDALEIIEHWSGEQMNYVTEDELDAAIDAALNDSPENP